MAGTAYTALFLGLASLTRHAVVVGLLFVLLWEGLLGGLLDGIRWLAIGAWGQEVAAAVSDAVDDPGTGLVYAVLAAAVADRRLALVRQRPPAVVHVARRRVTDRVGRGRPSDAAARV